MNSEDLKTLGKAIKLKHPEYAEFEDEDVGRLIHQKYPNYLSPQDNPRLSSTVSPKALRQQTENLAALENNHRQRTAAIQAISQQQDLSRTRQANLAGVENQTTVFEKATSEGLDPVSYAANKLAEETHRRELAKADHVQKLAIEQAKANEDNRLRGYKREVRIDMEAIRNHRLLPHSTVLGISAHLQQLIIQRENILKLNVAEETRTKLLETQDELIGAFKENLNVQIQRHLLEAGNKEDVGTDKEDSEGGGDHRADDAGGEEPPSSS